MSLEPDENQPPLHKVFEGKVEGVQLLKNGWDPPHQALDISFKVTPVPLVDVHYDSVTHRVVRTSAGFCDRENTNLVIPIPETGPFSVGDTIIILREEPRK